MGRLVDADELKTAFPCGESVRTESVRATIDHMATVDAESVRHGRWEGKPIAGYSTVRCSECGDVFMENSGKWNYCPNCGAKMDEVKE